ncbi:hypothetical protein D3C71_1181820 [compost metagenome]
MDSVHRFSSGVERPLPQQNGTVRSCSRQQHAFPLWRVEFQHQLRGQRIDPGASGKHRVDIIGYRDRQIHRRVHHLLPGSLPAQWQHAFAHQMRRPVNDYADTFIARDGRQRCAMAISAGDGDQIRGINRGKKHLYPQLIGIEQTGRNRLQLEDGLRLTKAAIS